MRNPIDIQQALEYEIESSWWAELIGAAWAQDLAARYFAWKVKRKMGRIFAKNRRLEEIYSRYPKIFASNQNPKPKTMTRQPVKSSQLAAIGYDPIGQILEVEFHPTKKQTAAGESGSIYRYESVPPDIHAQLMAAESVGSFFIAVIKSDPKRFLYQKVS